jgi:hypothetical protein
MPESIGIFLAVVFLSFRFRMRAVANQGEKQKQILRSAYPTNK